MWAKAMQKIKSKNGQFVSSEKEIFDRHTNFSSPSSCWEWISYKNPKGYGQTRIGGRNGKSILAHRLSWILHYGEIKNNLHVCHKCDNPSCVNPNHLFLGTNLDNIKDRVRKNRSSTHLKNAPREKHPRCKISNDKILEMVNLRKSGIAVKQIAAQFGLSVEHTSRLTFKFVKGA